MIDDVRYNINVFIVALESVEGETGVVEPGQHVVLYPKYVMSEEGKVDPNDEHNKPLLALRYAHVGESFNGLVAVDRWGSWMLVRVDTNK